MIPRTASPDHWIQFIGGPFDGYQQSYRLPAAKLATDVIWLVTRDAFAQLDTTRSVPPVHDRDLTSVALYALDVSADLPKYRHAGSIGPTAFRDTLDNLD